MASERAAAALLLCAAAAWICVTTTTAAVAANKTSPSLAKVARLPGALGGSSNESQQKQLNPQLFAFFLRPLAAYLASLTGAAPAAGAGALDDWSAPAAQALTLPSAPSKLSLLANLFGFGQPAVAEGENPSYYQRP